MSLFKKERFSIRKICGIVGSVLLGSILVAPSIIHASTYHYVEKSALTKEEQSKIQAGIPTDNEVTYALIYQQEALPATGSSTSVLTALGLLAVGSLVLLVHKKKKVSSLFLVTTIGLISLSSMQALDISNPLKAPSNEGVVQIAGYRYIGYLPLDDDAISEIQHKAEGTKNVPVSEIQSVHNEAPKVEKPEYTAPVGTVPDEAPKAEKPEYTKPVGGNLVEPEVHEKPEYTKPVGTVPDEAPKAEKPEYTKPVGTVPDEAPKADKPEYTKPVGTVPDEAPKAEKPEYTKPVGTVPDEAPKAEKPEYTQPVGTVPDGAPKAEKPEYIQPVGTVPDKAPKAEKPEYTQPVGTVPDEAPKAEKPEYTQPVGTVPDEAPKAEKPEYTQPVGTVPDKAPKAEKPEYTQPVGTVPDEAPKAEKPEYTAPVGGNLVEPEVQPALPEAVVTEKGEPEVQPVLPEAAVTDKGEPEVQPTLPEAVVTEKGEPEVQLVLPEAVVTEKGEPEVQPTLPEAVVTEKGEPEVQLVLPEAVVTEKGEPEVQPALPEAVVTEKGEPEVQAELPEAVVTEKGEPEVQAELPEYTTKVAPTLTLDKVTEDAMDRSAKLDYTLENTDNAEIKSIIAEIKDGNTIVKRVDLSKEKLTDAVQGLDLFKDYKIATTMTYNRGEGDETSKLDEKPLRLELKKVEIKNIASTNLVKVNDDGTETPSDFMNEKPSDEDVKKMYLKITSRDNKVTRLAVDSIEEVTEEGKKLYKITAEAKDLIQHTDPTKVRNKYVHYIEKSVPKVNNVYYNFNELVRDMQEHPNGEFKLGADLNATNVSAFGKSYVTKDFKGKLLSDGDNHYTIHNLSRPLFGNVIGGTIKNINLGNVDINMPWADRIAPIADTIKGGAKIEDVKVTGNVLGRNWVSGFIDKIDSGGTLRNVAFIGNVTSIGTGSSFLTGIVGENWKGLVEQAYVDANIRGKKAKAAGIAYWSQNGGDNYAVGREGAIKKSVVKGTIVVEEPIEVGGAVGSLNMHGSIEDSVSMMKVETGEIFYGSHDISADPYWTGNNVNRNYVVKDVSKGTSSYKHSKELHRIKPITQEEADKKIKELAITSDKYAITEPIVNKLNALTTRDNEYKTTQDYKVEREQAYRNIEKLQPFYNKEWIVNQGNKLTDESNLVKKTVLSVTGMKSGQFVTDLSDIDKIMVHYADGTKEELAVTAKTDSKVAQVKEYDVAGQNIVYTPNMVMKNRNQLASGIKEKLASVTLLSDEVRSLMDQRDKPWKNTPDKKTEYIKGLYFEESFEEVKGNLEKLVSQILENEDHQLNGGEVVERALLKKVEDNKAKIMMGLTYLNRYYDIKYGDLSIKDIMMFKPDFYGKTPSVLDRLIQIGSREHFLKGDRTQDAYKEVIAGATGKGDLRSFLDYNMRLFTEDKDLNDWFIHSAKNVYVVEPETSTEAFKDKRHRVFDGLNNDIHGRMILPLLNLKKAHIFMISTYNTLAYSSFERYGKNTEEARESLKPKINLVAKAQQRYLDFWSRLALPSVRDKLLKSQNMVPTPVWDSQWYDGIPDANRQGYGRGGAVVSPIRELFGPTDRWHQVNGAMGAMAKIYGDPYKDDQVYFMVTKMLDDFGISAFTHETTHVNDRMVYYGGHRHREGTDLEAFAQGMLQTPDKSTPNSEYGALGINMAYERKNDGEQLYNYDPAKLDSRDKIDSYMKNYNESMMMLDYLEATAVINQKLSDNSKWFKKMDKEWRTNADRNRLIGEPHQWDKLRDLTEEEKKLPIDSIDKLVDNNFVTLHGMPNNGRFRTEGFDSAYQTVNMMAGIFGGNTSRSTVGSISFKHNTFRMWGYYGYENGFIPYVSNKLKGDANRENKGLLGDDFIIKKVSNNQFQNLEEWKKHWYHEVYAKAQKGFVEIEVDGSKISTYAQLQDLFNTAVEKDLKEGGFKHTEGLKWKVYKKLLQNTDGFLNPLFKI